MQRDGFLGSSKFEVYFSLQMNNLELVVLISDDDIYAYRVEQGAVLAGYGVPADCQTETKLNEWLDGHARNYGAKITVGYTSGRANFAQMIRADKYVAISDKRRGIHECLRKSERSYYAKSG
jgi:hypothetical protein